MNNSILNGTYDLTGIISKDAIDNPSKWLGTFNTEMGGIFIMVSLIVFGLVLYLSMRSLGDETDTKSAMYSGLITSVIGILIFVINITAYPDLKLISWLQLLPILIITAGAIYLDKTNRQF